jgi:hypothetical protein
MRSEFSPFARFWDLLVSSLQHDTGGQPELQLRARTKGVNLVVPRCAPLQTSGDSLSARHSADDQIFCQTLCTQNRASVRN